MTKVLKIAALSTATFLFSSAASAAVVTNFNNCNTAGVFQHPFTFISCSGGFEKNVLNNSTNGVDTQKYALQALGFNTSGFNFNSFFKIDNLNGGNVTSPPAPLMTGITIFGIHFGNSSVLGNATAFYKFNAGTGTTTIPFATQGSSDWVLYQTGIPAGVPEPASWMLLLGGFGLVGAMVRRHRKVTLAAN